MIRRALKILKPFSLALLVLVLAPCVVEFAFRFMACRSQLEKVPASSELAVSPSWYTHHELQPLQRIRVPADLNRPAVELRTNSLGLRGPEVRIARTRGALRIVCLGDETVLGAAVDEPQTFCRLIQDRLQARTSRSVEVINAGIPDFCPLLSYLQLKHRLLSLQPDVVIAHFDMSDVWDDRRFRRLTELSSDEEPLICAAPELATVPITRPFTQNFLSWQWAQQELSALVGQKRRLQTTSVDDPRSRYAWLTDDSSVWRLQTELALTPLTHLAGLCQSEGTRLLIATHPVPWQLSASASRDACRPDKNGIYPGTLMDSTRAEETLTEFASTNALPLCNAIPVFRRHSEPDELFQQDSTELSETGHRFYAAALTASLLESFPAIIGSPGDYTPNEMSREAGSSQDQHRPDSFTWQSLPEQPVRPAAFSSEPQGSANRPASTSSRSISPRQSMPANALVPFSGSQ